jgi:hypothetical protein
MQQPTYCYSRFVLSDMHYAKKILPCRWNGESLRESIKRHEHFLALHLHLKPGMKVKLFITFLNLHVILLY